MFPTDTNPIRLVNDGHSWCRVVPGDCVVHLEGPDDASPAHRMYPTGYDPACSWCWLGYTHSENAHARSRNQ